MKIETKIATAALSAALFVPMLLGGAMMNNSAIASAEENDYEMTETASTDGDTVTKPFIRKTLIVME